MRKEAEEQKRKAEEAMQQMQQKAADMSDEERAALESKTRAAEERAAAMANEARTKASLSFARAVSLPLALFYPDKHRFLTASFNPPAGSRSAGPAARAPGRQAQADGRGQGPDCGHIHDAKPDCR